jgi:enoyl-[acyl-carrier-protein] reductase (NADH)
MKPQEISSMALYLASEESSGMTGQSIHVDGGMVFS